MGGCPKLTRIGGEYIGEFPIVNGWRPENPEATKEYRRTMGVQAAVEWVE